MTEEAAERGAFGAPTMFFCQGGAGPVEGEQMFWGSDRFEMVAAIFKLPWLGPDPDNRIQHSPAL